jgi:hypothetical protein
MDDLFGFFGGFVADFKRVESSILDQRRQEELEVKRAEAKEVAKEEAKQRKAQKLENQKLEEQKLEERRLSVEKSRAKRKSVDLTSRSRALSTGDSPVTGFSDALAAASDPTKLQRTLESRRARSRQRRAIREKGMPNISETKSSVPATVLEDPGSTRELPPTPRTRLASRRRSIKSTSVKKPPPPQTLI